jgi:hypothetical protein
MPLRDRLRRLQEAARGGMDWLDLSNGSRYYFEPMEAHRDLFLERMDVLRAFAGPDLSEGPYQPPREPPPASPHVPAEIRAALAKATPESLRRFEEERYGPAEHKCGVVHNEDGRVTIRRMALDGSVETAVLEGEEAERFRREARGELYP